jgi:hypothetical protein
MKKTLLFLLVYSISLFTACYAQNNLLDSLLCLPAQLSNQYELRIYKGECLTNGGSVFIIRKNKDEWEAQIIQYFRATEKDQKFRFETKILAYTSNPEDFWRNVLVLNIEKLPQESAFGHKKQCLKIRKLARHKNKPRGENGSDMQFSYSQFRVMDGAIYSVKFKNDSAENNFAYSNPEAYLKEFPHIDELVYFCALLDLVRKEFNIDF